MLRDENGQAIRAPLPPLLAAESNTLAPYGRAKAAIRPVTALLSCQPRADWR
jgi:hypothetical protein